MVFQELDPCVFQEGTFACLFTSSMEWVQQRSTIIPNSGTAVTLNDTAPDTDAYNLAAVEILFGSAAGPHISTLSPVSGPVNTSVSISGSGFGATRGTSTVTFAGVAATPASWSDTTIVVPVPLGVPLGAASVIVTVGGVTSNAATFTVVDATAPAISITAPANSSFTNNPHTPISVSFSDGESGVDITSFHLLVDGLDHTAEFTTTATGSTGSLAAALPDGAHVVTANVRDLAGNQNSTTANFTVATVAPQITNLQPPTNSFTNAASVTVTGTITTSAPLASLTVNGDAATVTGNSFSSSAITLGAGPSQTISIVATDSAGNSASASLSLSIDRILPTIVATATPAAIANWNKSDVTVTFTCADDSSGIASCPSSTTVTTEGAAQVVSGTAVDVAGNRSLPASVTVNLDKTPPVITAAPAPAPNAAGWNNTDVNVTFICSDNLSGVVACPAPTTVSVEGNNLGIPVTVFDVAGNSSSPALTLNIDKTPPTISQLLTPDLISLTGVAQISAQVNDNIGVAQVVFRVNGTTLATFAAPPFQTNLQAPTGAVLGDILNVTVVATDIAGNSSQASHGVRVGADGVVVGQVLDDATSLPLQKANVQAISATGSTDQTDLRGRYSLPSNGPHFFLSIPGPDTLATTTVEREVFTSLGTGTVPVDARLTTLASPVTLPITGGTLTAGTISVVVPAGAAPDGTSFQLTPLSGQGLPGMLPIGWSPLLAFDLRASAPANGLTAGFSNLPNGVAHLATYDFSMHAWTLAASNLSITNGTLSIALPTTGDFALVLPDAVNPPIQLPPLGNPLSGIPVQVIPSTSTSSGSMNPPVLPASGGTAIATLGVVSPAPLPSGTVIQANVSEKFSLRSGQVASEDSRPEDIILYTALAPASSSLGAQFAVSPSHKFSNGELLTGKVHLDFLAGREAIRGQTGGNDPVTVTDGTATLSVPGGALAQNTAISVQGISLEDYVPTNTSMNALQEILVDISGETLNTPAQLSISASALNPADMFLLAQVVRVDGIPHLVTAALAHISGNSLVSVASPGLPGVMQGGEYVFYDFPSPIGFIAGVASSASGPLAGTLVQSDSLPLGYLTGIDGHYIVPALVASVTVNASVPDSTLAGSGTIQVVAGQTVALNIAMAGVVTSASISPADGSLGVTVSTTITVTTSAPLDPATVPQASLTLSQGVTPVPVGAIVLSQSGTTLSFAPVVNLNPATQYTVRVSGLSDVFHNPVVVPTSTFTTKAAAPPTFDPNAITFSFPDQNGNIHVTAPAGSLPPGTMVLIVDQSNGIVLSLTAGNDGSLSGNFLGTINDVLQVTVTDPHGASVSFTSTQFVAPDGSVAVGSNGGTVKGPGGIAMIIPSGALDQPAIFSIQPLGADAFPELPAVSGATFGSGIQVNSPSMPFLKKEVKFAFPKPADAPDDAFYYVYRQLTDQNNNNYFETLDHAFVQGTGSAAQVVMASPPFCGYRNSYKNFNTVANASFVPEVAGSNNIFVMWDRSTAQPGKASQGLIVGRALQTVPPNPGQTDPTFVPIQGATIWLGATDTPSKNVAITSDSCGQFTIFDPLIGGGPRDITAKASINGKDVILHTSVTEVNGVQLNDATYLITEGLAAQYRNIGRLTFTFPASTPPPPPAQVDVRLYTEDASNSRRIASGLLSQGTPLVIAFKTSLTVTGASIAGRQLTIVPDYLDNPKDPQALLDFRAVDSSSGDSLQRYIVGNPGPYTLSVTAISVFGGAPITVTKSFLVVASGGSNNVVTTGSHPQIISTIPVQNANRVSIGAFPEITFSEPVTNVPDGVTLTDADGNSPPFVALGVRADGSIANPVGSGDAITSLTIQPLTGLRLGTLYKVSLNSLIVDQNTPPLGLPPFTLQFTTISPQEADQNTDASPLTRSVIIGDRLYAGKFTGPAFSRLEVFDISDPTNPVDKTASSSFPGRSFDVAGLASSPVVRCLTEVLPGQTCPDQAGGGPLIAVAASIATTELPLPSNIWFYDVSQPDQPVRVGAMSATTSATQDGTVLRIFMKGGFVYASTFTKGLQVIDVQQAVNEFQQTPPDQFGGAITTEGNGFALDAVVNTIPIFIQQAPGSLVQALMFDVKAGDYATAFSPDPTALVPTQTLIVATGMVPLVIADPQLGGLSAVVYPPLDNSGTALSQTPLFDGVTGQLTLQQGRAVALGNIPVTNLLGATVNTQIAIVVGMGTSTLGGTAIPQAPVLAVIDMSNAKAPLSRGFVLLKDKAGNLVEPTDVVIKDNLALVGTAAKKVLVVNITDPNRPFLAGEIDGLFGDNLALTGDGTLFTTAPISAIGGVHSASFGSQCSIYRDLISKNPPSLPAINSTPQLGWSMSGGLSVTTADGEVFNRDGFVLTNVKLGRRQLAKSMSLPYVIIKRENDQDPDNPPRCELVNGSDNACTGLASGVNARSNLLTYSATTDNATFVAYQAQFLIDHLDGDPDTNPEVHDTCAVITQKYEFRKEGLKPFEPFGFFPSAKFVPQVSYSYFRDLNGPALESLQTAQRLHFDVRSLAQPDLPPPPAKYSVNNEMLTCDGNAVFGQITNCLPSALTNDSIVGLFQNENPLQQEHFVRIIQNGTSNLVSNPGAILPLKTTIDNFHQNPTPVTAPDQKIDEPGLTVFGCPACVHIHWRWSTNLNSDFPNVFNVDKLFDNNGGNLFLPPNPTQDVDIAIESSGVVHPNSPVQVKDLVSGTRSLLPSQVAQRNAQPVFWYVATGHKNSDQFFLHGGGFGTFFVNKVTAPEQGQGLLSINVEHTRALDYEVVVSRKDQIGTDIDGNLLFNVTSFPLLTGTLQPGTDDIAGSPDMALLPEDGTSNVHELTIDITLTDPTLAPRNIFKRSFSFSFPGTQEP
jgi:hypothetical protein